jgi:hypothetical protein
VSTANAEAEVCGAAVCQITASEVVRPSLGSSSTPKPKTAARTASCNQTPSHRTLGHDPLHSRYRPAPQGHRPARPCRLRATPSATTYFTANGAREVSWPGPVPGIGDGPHLRTPGQRLAHPSRVPLRVPLTAGKVFGYTFGKSPQNGAPLRNRTVDLLLTMNPRQVPSPQVGRVDQEKHEQTRALTSPR